MSSTAAASTAMRSYALGRFDLRGNSVKNKKKMKFQIAPLMALPSRESMKVAASGTMNT